MKQKIIKLLFLISTFLIETKSESNVRTIRKNYFINEFKKIYDSKIESLKLIKTKSLLIGFGCTQTIDYEKIHFWTSYLANSSFLLIEYDLNCLNRKYDLNLFSKIGELEPLDFIIDIGPPNSYTKLNSIISLFRYLKSGGFYLVHGIEVWSELDVRGQVVNSLMNSINQGKIMYEKELNEDNKLLDSLISFNRNIDSVYCVDRFCIIKKI